MVLKNYRKDTNVLNNDDNYSPGTIRYEKVSKLVKIRCKNGWVEFRKVKVKGFKAMTAFQFYNGFLSKVK